MQPQRRSDSDRSFASLEARLRALPQLPVPQGLEARVLATIPASKTVPVSATIETSRSKRFLWRWRLMLWSAAATGVAASCLLVIRCWPESGRQHDSPNLVAGPGQNESVQSVALQAPGDDYRAIAFFKTHRDLDETQTPTFTWPVLEKSPLMVSSELGSDLFD